MASDMHPSASGGTLRIQSLAQVSLLVRDTERAVAFYRDTLGITHLYTFGALAFLDVGGVRLYLQSVDDSEWKPSSALYFMVDDIADAYAQLQARRVTTSGAPHHVHTHADTGVAEWLAFFEDPDGNILALTSRVPPSRE